MLSLAILPILSPYLIKELSPRFLQSSELSVKHLDINYYHGRIELSGLALKHQQIPTFELKSLTIDIDLAALWRKQINVEKLHAAQGHISVHQDKNDLFIAELSLKQFLENKPEKGQQAANKASSWRSSLEDVSLRDFTIAIQSSTLNTQLSVKKANLADINFSPTNQQQFANSKLKLELEFNNSQVNHPEQPLIIDSGLSIDSELILKGPLAKPSIEGSVMIAKVGLSSPEVELLNLNELSVGRFLIELSNKKNGSITAAFNDTTLKQGRLLKIHEQSEAAIVIEQIQIDRMSFDKHSNHFSLSEISIKDSILQLDIDANKNITQFLPIEKLATSFQEQKNSKDKVAKQTREEAKPEILTFKLEKLLIENSNITIKDHNIKPLVSHNINVDSLQAGPYLSKQEQQDTKINLSATINQQAQLKAQATLTQLLPKPSLIASYHLNDFDLTAESPYLDAATGYFIHTGQLNSQAQISLGSGMLDTVINLKIRAIELQRTNQEKSERLDTSLQLPLDTTLSLLRDSNGDIDLRLPLQGDIHSPEFNINDALQQVSRKALTEASLLYLQQAFQPYGALISVGSWLHDQSKKIRLDPIAFTLGSSQLDSKKTAYLDKLGKLLNSKQSLRIKACPIIGIQEQQWLNQQTETDKASLSLEQISKQRVKALQQYLAENHQIKAAQIIACKPQKQTSSEPEASYIHLEI